MELVIYEAAEKELGRMDRTEREMFMGHIDKICGMPPRRHMRFGLPFNVENVTKQARFTYQIENGKLYILRCFRTHKDYEKWYKSQM